MLNKRKTLESLIQLIFKKDYIDIDSFSLSIMGEQIVGPDFAVGVINRSCMDCCMYYILNCN